mmetsp:Transcript_53212/g.86822  ORF Transcript_53212/g.86822 Transcript_53212/m.86822 type:complete len:206 (-) Transcript_53212:7-624(-)
MPAFSSATKSASSHLVGSLGLLVGVGIFQPELPRPSLGDAVEQDPASQEKKDHEDSVSVSDSSQLCMSLSSEPTSTSRSSSSSISSGTPISHTGSKCSTTSSRIWLRSWRRLRAGNHMVPYLPRYSGDPCHRRPRCPRLKALRPRSTSVPWPWISAQRAAFPRFGTSSRFRCPWRIGTRAVRKSFTGSYPSICPSHILRCNLWQL